jgi:nucleotidyltransferase/DNA polymerase involved in DNA repair
MDAGVETEDVKAKEKEGSSALLLERNRSSRSPARLPALISFASFFKTRRRLSKIPHIVHVHMNFHDALRTCPQAAGVAGKYEQYADFAERVRRILETYTPAVEAAALDGFFMDFTGTGRRYPDFEAALRRVQAEILAQTGLSACIGAGRTKVVAATASRLEPPRGFRMVSPGTEEAFLAPLPVETLHGIAGRNAGTLARRGVITIGQLRLIPKPVLIAVFGKAGQPIWRSARGLDELEANRPSRSGGWHSYPGREKPQALHLERTFL